MKNTPRLITAVGALAFIAVIAPLFSLFGRVNWGDFSTVLFSPTALSSLSLSFLSAAIASACCVVLGVPLAVLIARSGRRIAATLRAFVMVPLLMPPLVGGLALLTLFGRRGFLGPVLDSLFGVQLPFSTPAVIIAQCYIALPFLVIAVEQALQALDPRLEAVARSLGASKTKVWWRITLPLLRPAIVSGATLSFARALAEFGATAMFAGNREGVTRTMPLAIYTAFNGGTVDVEQAYTLAVILILAAALVIAGLRSWRVAE